MLSSTDRCQKVGDPSVESRPRLLEKFSTHCHRLETTKQLKQVRYDICSISPARHSLQERHYSSDMPTLLLDVWGAALQISVLYHDRPEFPSKTVHTHTLDTAAEKILWCQCLGVAIHPLSSGPSCAPATFSSGVRHTGSISGTVRTVLMV
ncbi:hypothetical protein ASPFODRAFT_716416 [Aspergillus luchuensis CBS 106.47]|uniref:Uncharacterized protein n=1 Tax=Aspergillus luchuensis (strain CBS 106.47) TaxID=1137211 RepID=A0A1M3THZ5_ASPLC|nr:hypothetical protein ASPFODRAFT_716416 [Aspergillus luchuensis CBS 106.47]